MTPRSTLSTLASSLLLYLLTLTVTTSHSQVKVEAAALRHNYFAAIKVQVEESREFIVEWT